MDTVKSILKDAIKAILFQALYPLVYKRACKKHHFNSHKVVFVQRRGAVLSDNFKLLSRRLRHEQTWDIHEAMLQEYRVSYIAYCTNCVRLIKEIASAGYVFLDDASDVVSCLPLQKQTKVIQLWHACGAFKKFGMSTADLKFGGSRKQKTKHPFYENLSLVTVSSSEVVWAYIEAMALESTPDIVQPLGVSRTDVFFDEAFVDGARTRVRSIIQGAKDKKILLYAPTFRGRVIDAKGPDALDVRALKRALGDTYVLLVKHHPYVVQPPALPPDCEDFAFIIDDASLSIDVLLSAADICISDYSSLVFEYSLFTRPMVFFAYDIEDYNDWRGFYYSYEDLTPGPVVSTNEELIDYLVHVDKRFDRKRVEAFRDKYMSACDGHATDRIIQSVFESPKDF